MARMNYGLRMGVLFTNWALLGACGSSADETENANASGMGGSGAAVSGSGTGARANGGGANASGGSSGAGGKAGNPCANNALDSGEEGVDCGGSCAACPEGDRFEAEVDGKRVVLIDRWKGFVSQSANGTSASIDSYGSQDFSAALIHEGTDEYYAIQKGPIVLLPRQTDALASQFNAFFVPGPVAYAAKESFNDEELALLRDQQELDPTAPNAISIRYCDPSFECYTSAGGDQTGSLFEFVSMDGHATSLGAVSQSRIQFEARFNCKLYAEDDPSVVLTLTNGRMVGRFLSGS
jgi:hypothetical protein